MVCTLARVALVAALGPLGARSEAQPISKAPTWQEADHVEVFYGEFLLSSWVLDAAPWNAYHSGLAFVNNATGEKALFEFTPVDAESTTRLTFPLIEVRNPVSAWLFGDAQVTWRNDAQTVYHDHWARSYETFTRVGRLNGTAFNTFVHWAQEYSKTHVTFEPIEVIVVADGRIVSDLRSSMCHDFVTNGLWALYWAGAMLRAEDDIFRDHILMYASSFEIATDHLATAQGRREHLRFFRLLFLYLEEIKVQFTFGRDALITAWKLGLEAYVSKNRTDYRVQLASPFLNYCYLPLAIPPRRHNPLGASKLCALALEANVTNTSIPFPWGVVLGAEEQLDRPEVLVAMCAVFIVLVAQLPRRSTAREVTGAK